MLRIVKFVLLDILKSRIVIAYTLFLLAVSFGLFQISDDASKGIVSLMNIVLIVAPLVAIVFSTIHFYNSYEFVELLAAQPIRRSAILWGEFLGLGVALSLSVLLGTGLPVLIFSTNVTGLSLVVIALALTWVFTATALLAAVGTRDKTKGIGVVLLLWFFLSLLYDALVLFVMFSFADYPLEKAMIAFAAFNPIDLARIIMLLQLDIAALMGYTGALFQEFLGTHLGVGFAIFVLLLWVVLPLFFAFRIFNKKDI